MLSFDKRFFTLDSAVYNKRQRQLRLVFLTKDNFHPEIPSLEKTMTRQVNNYVQDNITIDFEYLEPNIDQDANTQSDAKEALEKLQQHTKTLNTTPIKYTDKTLLAKNIEYLCGRYINIRPIRIQYLRVSAEEQVTAGTMHFLTRREYKRKSEGGEEVVKPYFTFTLNDGIDTLPCVFFPSQKTLAPFEKLVDHTTIAIIGVHDRKNDRLNFRVTGVSFCEM